MGTPSRNPPVALQRLRAAPQRLRHSFQRSNRRRIQPSKIQTRHFSSRRQRSSRRKSSLRRRLRVQQRAVWPCHRQLQPRWQQHNSRSSSSSSSSSSSRRCQTCRLARAPWAWMRRWCTSSCRRLSPAAPMCRRWRLSRSGAIPTRTTAFTPFKRHLAYASEGAYSCMRSCAVVMQAISSSRPRPLLTVICNFDHVASAQGPHGSQGRVPGGAGGAGRAGLAGGAAGRAREAGHAVRGPGAGPHRFHCLLPRCRAVSRRMSPG